MSSSKKCSNKTLSSQQNKRSHNNDNDLLFEEPQWIDIGNKSSWVWKYCRVKTDGHAYCRYIINENEETEWSVHKKYEEKYEDIEVNQNVQDSSASTDQDLSNLNSEIDKATTYTSLKILQTINECNTQWGSSLASWKCLKELKETSKEAKKDYEILKKRFLKYWKWDLLDHLIDLFKPIEKATEWLVTDAEVLFASILDPRFKKMKGWPEEEKEKTITLLRSEYTLFKNDELLNRESGNKNRYHFKEPKEKTISNFKSRLFEEEEEKINDDDEIDCYLRFQTPQANSDKDLFKWWKDNKKDFSIFFKISQKYLGIPATSVPSERLF
ncbi:24919_t:CDS:2, partial [Cetraspora pellucida]